MDKPPGFRLKDRTEKVRKFKDKIVDKGGRPTLFKESMIEQASNLILMGYTHEKIAEFYKVSIDSIYKWKRINKQFKKAMNINRDDYDGKVVRSLFEIATGYDYTEKKKETESINGVESREKVTKTKKHMAPNVGAIKVWLYNRRPGEFKPEVELSRQNSEELPPPPPLNITYTVTPPVKDVKITIGSDQ